MTEVAFDTSMVAPGEGEFLDTGTFDGNDQTGPQSADPSADVEVEEEFDFELGGASDAENFGHVDVDGGMQNEVALSVPESARDMRAESEIGYEDDANDEAPLSNPDVAETADLEAQDVDEIDYVDSTAGFNNTEVDDVAQETASVEPDQAGEKVEDDPDDETSGFNMDADAAGQSQDIHDGQAEAHTPEAQGSGNSPHHASPSENDLGAKAGGPRDAAGEPASFVAPGPEVYVIYNDATYELCARPGNEDPDTFFFAGEEELDYSLYRFLGCLRGVIADDLASGDKVHLRIDQLDLEIGETSSQSFLDHTTFREIIDLFRKLLQNDGITETADCPRLDVQLFVRQDCEQRFSDLLDAANAGTGLSELVDDHNYSDFSDGSSPTGPGDAGEEQRDGGMAGAEALESHGDEPRQDVSHDGDDVTDTQQNAAADALEVDLGAYEENYGDEEASIPTAGDSNLTNNQNAAQPDRDEQGSADDEAEYAAEDNVYLGKDDDEIGYDEFDGPVDAQADQNTNPGNNAPEDGHLSGEVNYPQTEAFAPTTAPEGAEDGEQQEDNGVDHVDGQEIVDEGHPVSAEQDEDNQDGYAAEDVDDVVGFDGDGDDAEEVEEAEDQRTTDHVEHPSPAQASPAPDASQVSVREAGDEDNYVEFEGGELDDQPVAPEHDSARKETGATQLSLPESLSKVTESGPSSATSTLKGDEISYEEDAEEVDDDFDVDIHAADGEENSAAADEIDWENDGYDDAGHPAVEEEEGEIVEQGGDDLSSVSIKRRRQVDDASDLAGESADAKRRRT
ncbi:hypothetical protein VTK73DRAFT_7530 [Phialemonium thermophilum]|uniref:Uncharacterized protein n=1 Tax=Phialemonium thermophilum TaxID=223376 RepID=A0ABR3WE09_9PEZI